MNYLQKDKIKFQYCTKLITRGTTGSSSDLYRDPVKLGLDLQVQVNDTEYSDIDVVGVSVNGKRPNRISFDRELVKTAVLAGAVIIKDNSFHTNRSFNIGEQELESFLKTLGAVCIEDNQFRSAWKLTQI